MATGEIVNNYNRNNIDGTLMDNVYLYSNCRFDFLRFLFQITPNEFIKLFETLNDRTCNLNDELKTTSFTNISRNTLSDH